MHRALSALLVMGLTGCNGYDLFRLSGYEQDSFSNRADVLFVIDNSDSMVPEVSALAANFDGFIKDLQEREENLPTDGLGDAVENYQAYVQDRAAFLNYQFGITTTFIGDDAGKLLGSPEVIAKGDDKLAKRFIENLLCDATCWRDGSFDDPDLVYDQGDLDDICGAGNWLEANCAETGVEEGLEAVFMALCRAVPNPPSECFEDITVFQNDGREVSFDAILKDRDRESNGGFVRTNSTFIPVIVSDEGDDSRRMASGDALPTVYQDLFAKFARHIAWVTISPPLDATNGKPCDGYTDWGALRYDLLVDNSNGLKIDISDPDAGCAPTDFGAALEQLGELLSNTLTNFELQSVPVTDTILVYVEGEQVQPSDVLGADDFGIPLYGDGWTYEPSSNAIAFHGAAVPPNDAVVEVYYEPLDGMPRELPF